MSDHAILAQTIAGVIIVSAIFVPLEAITDQLWLTFVQLFLCACCLVSEVIRLRMKER